MTIINSKIISSTLQVDGSFLTHERHTDHAGFQHDVQYFAPADWDTSVVLSLRAAAMNAEMLRRDQLEAEAVNFELPITFFEFMDRFTSTERKAIRVKEKTNEDLIDFLDLARTRRVVYLNNPRTIAAVNLLVSLGCITAAHAIEVLR